MVELGKPVHTYDAAAVARAADGLAEIVVRAHARRRAHRDDRPRRPRADAGHAPHRRSPRSPSASPGSWAAPARRWATATTSVIVESAIFDPVSIRRTAFRYALRSDASLRFEKGQEFRLARLGADRTARLVTEWAGGRAAAGVVDSNPSEPQPRRVAFRPARVDRLLGTDLGADGQREVLARVGIATEPAAGATDVQIAAGSNPETVRAGRWRGVSSPPSRRGAATSRSRRTSPRRSPASTATSAIPGHLPATPLPELAREPARGPRRDPRGARRGRPDRGRELRPRQHQARRDVRVAPGRADRRAARRPARAARSRSATRCRATTRSSARRSIGSLVEVVQRNVRHGNADVLAFEVGKGYGRVGDSSREWWRLGLALTGAVRGAGVEPARAATPTSTTRRASSP